MADLEALCFSMMECTCEKRFEFNEVKQWLRKGDERPPLRFRGNECGKNMVISHRTFDNWLSGPGKRRPMFYLLQRAGQVDAKVECPICVSVMDAHSWSNHWRKEHPKQKKLSKARVILTSFASLEIKKCDNCGLTYALDNGKKHAAECSPNQAHRKRIGVSNSAKPSARTGRKKDGNRKDIYRAGLVVEKRETYRSHNYPD
jgi:hypothetical protein